MEPQARTVNRIYSLDQLRGLSALGIMLYHYSLLISGDKTSEHLLTRIGVYGVEVFYVLSGLTLFHVYANKLTGDKEDVAFFYFKRILRIYPLFYLAIFLTIAVSGELPGGSTLFSNLSGLFGFYDWNHAIPYGGWSIGNELVFYSLFPLIINPGRRPGQILFYFWIITLGVYILIAFYYLQPASILYAQWRTYTNPLNHFFLFTSGIGIGFLSDRFRISRVSGRVILIFSLVIFGFYPVGGEKINLVTGWPRLIFTVTVIGICAGVFKSAFRLPSFFDNLLVKLGYCSYSVYLLHPVIIKATTNYSAEYNMPPSLMLVLSFVLTPFISYAVYSYFEKYFIKPSRQIVFWEFLKNRLVRTKAS